MRTDRARRHDRLQKEPVADAVDNTHAADAPKADDAKPAADAPKADDAKPAADAPKADDAKPALSYKEAIDKATNVMQALSDAATGAGDNCEKMATDLTAALEKGKADLLAAMPVLAKLDENSEEAKALKPEIDKFSQIMGEDSDYAKATVKCKDDPNMLTFGAAFLTIMMQAAAEAQPTADAQPAADAPKADDTKPADAQ